MIPAHELSSQKWAKVLKDGTVLLLDLKRQWISGEFRLTIEELTRLVAWLNGLSPVQKGT